MIKPPQPPSEGPGVVQRAVAYVQEQLREASTALVDFPPMPVYTATGPIAWWYPSPLGAAEVADANDAVSFHSGAIVDRLPAALARAEELATDGEFELRLLRVPQSHTVALWVHGSRDAFVPLTSFAPIE